MNEPTEESITAAIREDLSNLDGLTECVLTHAIVVAATGKRRIKYDGPMAEKIAIQECLDWWARKENTPKRPLLREVHRKMKPVIRLLIQDMTMGS